MQTLVLCEDIWHPADIVRQGLEPLAAEGYRFDFRPDLQGLTIDALTAYALVVLAKENDRSAEDESPWATPQQAELLARAVSMGTGLLALHSGIAGYEEAPVLLAVLGGRFVQHPEQCPVTVTPRAGHPLTTGCEPFSAVDEHYFVELIDPAVDVFLTTTSEHGSQPGGWRRAEGRGRVCVLTPGHNLEVWLQPGFQRLLENAAQYCLNPTQDGQELKQ